MIKEHIISCNGCGLKIDQARRYCPRCNYPLDRKKEEQFLIASIHDLRRIVTYGRAELRVIDLLRLYQARLETLQQPPATTLHAPTTITVSAASTQIET